MAQLSTKIKKYLAANSVDEVDFLSDVLLQDDGSGAYIKEWNVSGVAKPTDSQLDSYDTAADLEERQNAVRATRRQAYGDIGEQLDKLWHDINNGTLTTSGDFYTAINTVKTDNPKPTE